MSRAAEHHVLALFPSARGLGFAYFTPDERLVDWGAVAIRTNEKNAAALIAARRLLVRFAPTVVALEDAKRSPSRRHPRIKQLEAALETACLEHGSEVLRFSPETVREYFGTRTKHELAEMIGRAFPAIAHRVPPARKPWTSEDLRQALFDAVALALVCFAALAARAGEDPPVAA